jgi:hypothetical protein
MSRTNPFKRKYRYARKTILFVGEGQTEKAFLDYVKSVYLTRDAGVSISVRPADGGSPEQMLNKAIRWKEGFDQTFILLDADIPLPWQFMKKASSKKITVLLSDPCIEGEFLAVLQHAGFNKTGKSPEVCKRVFHQRYLSEDDKMDRDCYKRFFTRELFESSIINVDWLCKIVTIVRGKYGPK